MHDARVLVVDDSAAMRALFCDVLEQSKNVRVVGTAANANEARDLITEVMPNVITLDVEMPGMSGIEFLDEVMQSGSPLPIVMLSSLTQSGTETSLKAFELGAVECFPKPLKSSPEEFAAIVSKLGKIVVAAANSNVRSKPKVKAVKAEASDGYVANGTIAAYSASMGGVDALSEVLSSYPAKCPPTVIVLQTEPAVASAFIARANKEFACSVVAAEHGAKLEPGTVHIASDPARHIVVEPGEPPVLRLVERDPVEGFRPSATLLFGSIARGGKPAIGAVLTGMGEDGARGLKLLRDAGCKTLAQDRNSATVPQAPAAAVAAGAVDEELGLGHRLINRIQILAEASLTRAR